MAHDATAAPTPERSAIAMGDDTTTKRSAVTVALLVLACCRLALAFPRLSPPSSSLAREDDHGDPAAHRVEPVGYLASVASSVLAAYIAASATRGVWRPRAGALLAEARRTWARPAATALYVELLTAAMASLLHTLGAFLAAIVDGGGGGGGSAAAGLLAATGSVALVGWLGPVLFAPSDIACRMSLVVAAMEDGLAGAAAVRRAEALVAGRRASGLAVGLVAGAIEQAPACFCRDGAPALVLAPAVLAAKVAACCACAAFYYDCRRRHDMIGSRLKLEGVTKSCQMDGCDMGDESEVEEFGSAFEFFRLT